MTRLYEKNQLRYSLLWIAAYVAGASAADLLSASLGMEKSATFPLLAVLSLILLGWLRKNGLFSRYGLCRPAVSARQTLYYLPLVFTATCNLWFGVEVRLPPAETLLYIGSMLCVGLLEEVLFRGLLFRAIAQNDLRTAVLVSSLTFGLGHIVNLFNGSGMTLFSNLLQICYAAAFGFLFVTVFCRTGSLLPCILTHGILNALSAFGAPPTPKKEIAVSVLLTLAALGYAAFLHKTQPPHKAE